MSQYQDQDLENGIIDERPNPINTLKQISVLPSLVLVVWAIVALALDNKAYGDSNCGNIYEIGIFILVILCMCFLNEILLQIGYEDSCMVLCIELE
jgi:hypothetical protein